MSRMPSVSFVADLDLSPIPGKLYLNADREWREEFIYFLPVDRFHDEQIRHPTLQTGRSAGHPNGHPSTEGNFAELRTIWPTSPA